MSTVRQRHDSDSEDDDDYLPPPDDDSDSSEDELDSKPVETLPPSEADGEKKKARDALWASFQESVATPHVPSQPEPPKEMVRIKKRYRFAGEDVIEVVDVPADSPDAKKWPVWHAPEPESIPPVASVLETPVSTPSTNNILPDPSTSKKSPTKRSGPRKPKVSFAAIPTQKAKKLSTLDKSAMDWQSHVQAQEGSGLKDELEANRRSGGYLDKVEFLKRVDERKGDVIEASRSSKRRKL